MLILQGHHAVNCSHVFYGLHDANKHTSRRHGDVFTISLYDRIFINLNKVFILPKYQLLEKKHTHFDLKTVSCG